MVPLSFIQHPVGWSTFLFLRPYHGQYHLLLASDGWVGCLHMQVTSQSLTMQT